MAGLAYTQVRPPNYSPDRLPETSFTCEDKVSGSYYADVEASCQLFHVCVQVSELEVSILDSFVVKCFMSFGLTSRNLSSLSQKHHPPFQWIHIPLISISVPGNFLFLIPTHSQFQDFHFLCPNDTVFDQQHLVCTNWFDVDCQQSLTFFPHDFAFDKGRPEDYHDYTDYKERPDYDYEYADVDSDHGTQTFLGFSQPASR